jgi:hypothetical protein
MNDEKNYLDGIKSPVQKKSIKDIPVPTRKNNRTNSIETTIVKKPTSRISNKKSLDLREEFKKEETKEQMPVSFDDFARKMEEEDEEDDFEDNRDYSRGGSGKKKILPKIIIAASVLAFIFIFIGVSNFFASAKVIITPKTSELTNLNIDIPIIDESVGNKELLNYKVMDLEETATKVVDSEKEEDVENKASGVITVYNEFNKEGQRLIQNTRFETSDGLIYRIKNSINVPGYTEAGGKKNPGSVDVEVFADQAGDKYNIGKTDFKVPGFKGQEQYDFFYAKSKSDMTGGFTGVKNTVGKETFEANVNVLKKQIADKIVAKVKEQNSDNYVYVYKPDNFTYLEPKQNNASGKKVEISLTGNAKIYVIEKTELSKKIAEKGAREYDGNPVLVKDFEKITITTKENDVEVDDKVLQSNNVLNIAGDAVIVWQNDFEQLKKDLAGKDKKELNQVVSTYPGISKASASLNILWKSDFPKNVNKIKIEIE